MPPPPRLLPRLLHGLLLLSLLCLAGAAQAERRVAFVLGNEAYKGRDLPPLNNPARDAAAMTRALESVGFDVWPKGVRTNLDRNRMEAELRAFRAAADGAEIGLIYFAGHGMQDSGENYLFPTDADPAALADLPRHSFTMTEMMNSLSGVTRLKIGLFDACRDNQMVQAFRAQEIGANRSARAALLNRGMGRPVLERSRGAQSLVVFPTEPGQVTTDGAPGGNSPFAASLARHLPRAGLEVRFLFGEVADEVEQATGYRQRPEVVQNLGGGRFYLVEAAEDETPIPPPAPLPASRLEAASAISRGSVSALIVGIDEYDHEMNIYGAVADARDIEGALQSFGIKRTTLLLNRSASKAAIEKAWRELKMRSAPGDTLVFTYSGHGAYERDLNADEALQIPGDERDENLLLSGFSAAQPGERIVDDELALWFREAGDQGFKILFIGDASHSGTLCDSAPSPGSQIFCASAMEQSRPVKEVTIDGRKRGALSYLFARALEGAADYNKDGVIDHLELGHYLETASASSDDEARREFLPKGGTPVPLLVRRSD